MYTAKEYQQLILNILEMKVRDLDKKMQKAKNSMEEETLSNYQIGLYEAINTIKKSSFLVEEE